MLHAGLLVLATLLTTAVLTGLVRRFALAAGVLDVPNQRSSHTTPTARGGGLAIVVATTLALLLLKVLGAIDYPTLAALSAGGAAVALVGWLDDRKSLSRAIRLTFHLGAAVWALLWLGGVPPLPLAGHLVTLGAAGYLVGALGIAWSVNLFNFMDGIDGIAAGEAMFIAWAGAGLGLLAGTPALAVVAAIFGAACCGFLLWNWPPARIFMGDVGSGYLGYVIAVMALAAAHHSAVALLSWLILGGVFFVDATVTLLRRFGRGERVHEAHRSHAYQVLARRWRSHRQVTSSVMLVNLIWLLPCATLATLFPSLAIWITLVALAPLVVVALSVGAGKDDLGTRN